MSESTISSAATEAVTAPPAPVMPLFFNRVVGVNPGMHGGKKLNRDAGFGFARAAQSVPIGLGEFDVISQHFPIVFATGPTPTPLALLGLGEGSNLFVEPSSQWKTDSYVPAYVRAFPFVFIEEPGTGTVYVGMEADAECVTDDVGAPMFEDGKPTSALTDSINFAVAFRDNLNAANAFGKALDAAGLLQEEEATVSFTSGGGSRIRGFKILKADRLDQISDETFIDWRRRGWIGPLYAHLHSASRWGRLIELAAASRPA